MSEELMRYSRIDDHMKREFLLLQGKGCVWGNVHSVIIMMM